MVCVLPLPLSVLLFRRVDLLEPSFPPVSGIQKLRPNPHYIPDVMAVTVSNSPALFFGRFAVLL